MVERSRIIKSGQSGHNSSAEKECDIPYHNNST